MGGLGCGLKGGGGEGRATVAWDLGVVEAVVVEAWRRVERGRDEKVSTEKGSLGGMAGVFDHGYLYGGCKVGISVHE